MPALHEGIGRENVSDQPEVEGESDLKSGRFRGCGSIASTRHSDLLRLLHKLLVS